jgi:hypothetical protein
MVDFSALPYDIQRILSRKAICVRRAPFIPVLRQIESQVAAVKDIAVLFEIDQYIHAIEVVNAMSTRIILKTEVEDFDNISGMLDCIFGSFDMIVVEEHDIHRDEHHVIISVALSYLSRHSILLCDWLHDPIYPAGLHST